MKLSETLTSLFSRLGVDTTTDEAKTILGNPALATIEVADAVSTRLAGDFFTKESAMQNPDIRSTLRAEALNGVDAEVDELGKRFELDADTMTTIKAEKKSGKRYAKLVETIADLKEKKAYATGKDKDALTKQIEIEKLNADIVSLRTEGDNRVAEVEKLRKTDKICWELDGIYNEFDYALPTEKSVSIMAAKSIIERTAQEKGLRFEISDKGVQILTKEGTPYFDNNIQVNTKDFIKRNLLEKKVLKVSDNGSNGKEAGQRSPRQEFGNMPKQHNASSFESAIGSMIEATPAQQ